MIEEITQVYDNVDIKVWAEQIREIKIREFAEAIKAKQEEGLEYGERKIGDFAISEAIDFLQKSQKIAFDLIRMEIKFEMLKKA